MRSVASPAHIHGRALRLDIIFCSACSFLPDRSFESVIVATVLLQDCMPGERHLEKLELVYFSTPASLTFYAVTRRPTAGIPWKVGTSASLWLAVHLLMRPALFVSPRTCYARP